MTSANFTWQERTDEELLALARENEEKTAERVAQLKAEATANLDAPWSGVILSWKM